MKLSVNQEPQAIFWKASSWTGKSVGPYQFNVCLFWQIIIPEWCYCSPQTAPHLLDQSSLAAWPFSWSDTSGTMSSMWGGAGHVVNTYSYARLFINLLPHIIGDHLLSTVSFAGLSGVSQMNVFSKPLSRFLGTELGSLEGAVRPWEFLCLNHFRSSVHRQWILNKV